jgi:hypothetical protein
LGASLRVALVSAVLIAAGVAWVAFGLGFVIGSWWQQRPRDHVR